MPWPCYMVEYLPVLHRAPVWRELRPNSRPAAECSPASYPLQYADLRPGAMWWDDDDLCVLLPGDAGEWNIDLGAKINADRAARGQSDRLAQWSRTGTAPRVTASPSINVPGRYHSFLRNGVLEDDLEGRTYG